ncbi:MAG: AI-2E family transporter [Candidatus Zambryskibacteria bacterium]|nr:AI-2E family transporter [Candidatus Zambryskibacteria bacterium]
MNTQEHSLSWDALSRIVIMGVAILLLWKALGAVVVIIISLVLSASLYPLIQTVHIKTKLPLLFSILTVFLILLIPFIIIGVTIIPSFNTQFPELLTHINTTIKQIPFISNSFNGFDINQYLQSHYSFVVNYSKDIILTIVSIITIIILTFYLIYDYERLLKLFLNIFPYQEKTKLKEILGEIAKVTGQYIRGNVIISIISIFVIFVGLLIIGVPFALPLAIFSGILDLLPLVGSTIGAVPALLVAFSLSPTKGFFVLILFLLYQQIENAFIGPAIYNKALNLYPALVFLSVILGASLFGILGAFLALPIAASIPVVVEYHQNYKNRHTN